MSAKKSVKTPERTPDVVKGNGLNNVSEVKIVRDRTSGRAKAFAFVTFETTEGVQKAIDTLQGASIKERAIHLSVARPREERPAAHLEWQAVKVVQDLAGGRRGALTKKEKLELAPVFPLLAFRAQQELDNVWELERGADAKLRGQIEAGAKSIAKALEVVVSDYRPSKKYVEVIERLSAEGQFETNLIVIGSAAVYLYQGLFGKSADARLLATEDLDLLVVSTDNLKLKEPLMKAGLTPKNEVDPLLDNENEKQRGTYFFGADIRVDILGTREERDDPWVETGVTSGALPHLKYLLENRIKVYWPGGSGRGITVPQPARFAVHKYLLSNDENRKTKPKGAKDALQAKWVHETLLESEGGWGEWCESMRQAVDALPAAKRKRWDALQATAKRERERDDENEQ